MINVLDKIDVNLKVFKIIKPVLLIVLSYFLLKATLFEGHPYPNGDGVEYVLMEQAFFNHQSPDLRVGDVTRFKRIEEKYVAWPAVGKAEIFDLSQNWLEKYSVYLQNDVAIYTALNGKKYSYHFWFYPVLNIPARFILEKIHIDPFRSGMVTNALLIILTLAFVFYKTRFHPLIQIIGGLTFVFSAPMWYLDWIHPEVFASCFTFVGVLLFLEKRYYPAILLTSLAATHFPPLFVMTGIYILKAIIDNGFKWKNLLYIGLCSFWIILPSLFFYYHFKIPNLIAHAGYLDQSFITWTRFQGFFFDLNQGMILALPLILPILIVWYLMKFKNYKNLSYDMMLIPGVMAMVFFFMPMTNWNHGQNVLNRYAVWSSMILIAYFIYIIDEKKYLIVGLIALLTQVGTVLYHKGYKAVEWDTGKHKEIAVWTLSHFPQFYNPDPDIFAKRTIGRMSFPGETVIFKNDKNEIMKMMIHKDAIDTVKLPGVSTEKLNEIKPNLKYVNGWAYINRNDFN